MVNVLNLEVQINKERIYKNLHLVENTISYKCADDAFLELSQIIRDNMKLTCVYNIVDNIFDFPFKEIESYTSWKKYVFCFISSKDNINNIVNDMMSVGDYLRGYLLNEIATDVIFNASNEMNIIIKREVFKLGYKLTKRYAPGDGVLDLIHQQTILDALKKEVHIDAYLTKSYMIVPEKSMLYLFGAENIGKEIKAHPCNASNLKEELIEKDKKMDEDNDIEENCSECSNLNCQYRVIIDSGTNGK